MQKILFTLGSFFPEHRAGTEVYVFNLCQYFIKKGYTVNVLIAVSGNTKDYIYEGIPVFTFPIPSKPCAKELNGIIPPRGIKSFMDRIKEINPDMVHFHSLSRAINGYHLQAVKAMGLKTAFTPHLSGTFCIKGNLLLMGQKNCDARVDEQRCMNCLLQSRNHSPTISTLLSSTIKQLIKLSFIRKYLPPPFFQAHHRKNEIQRINEYADIVYSIAPWIQEAFELNGIHKAKLIPQGVNDLFFTNEKTIKLEKEASSLVRFGFIGRMFPIKGFHLLIEALDKIKHTNYELHIITMPSGGETEYFTNAKKWAYNKTNAIWNESLSSQEVKNYYAKIDCLILPSINEMAPLASLESLACKTPILCSDIPAFKNQVTQYKGGILFNSGNTSDLAKKIDSILSNKKKIEELSNSIHPPLSLSQVASIIEKDYLKLFADDIAT